MTEPQRMPAKQRLFAALHGDDDVPKWLREVADDIAREAIARFLSDGATERVIAETLGQHVEATRVMRALTAQAAADMKAENERLRALQRAVGEWMAGPPTGEWTQGDEDVAAAYRALAPEGSASDEPVAS